MQRLIDSIREKYPMPVRAGEHIDSATSGNCNSLTLGTCSKKHYCVAGAWMLYEMRMAPFPSYGQLAATLKIPLEQAKKIIDENDHGNFELSWELLAQAIEGK